MSELGKKIKSQTEAGIEEEEKEENTKFSEDVAFEDY